MPPLVFENARVLWLLLGLPLLAWVSWVEHRRRAVLRFSATHVFFARARGIRPRLLPLVPALRMIAIASAIIALARPQLIDARKRDLSVEGIDIVIALDLSISMEAGDFRPNNRLHVAKQVLAEFLDKRTNDRIGLVVFAGAAYTQAPLTLDYGVLKGVIAQLRTRALEDGTAIGDALATSVNRLRESEAKSRVVILITDGDNNSGRISPMDATEIARNLGIKVFTILVGKGGRVPFPAGQDLFGNTAWRELEIPINPKLLQEIAKQTGGEYYRATDRNELAQGMQKVLDAMERSKLLEGGVAESRRELFHTFVLLALVGAGLSMLLRVSALRVFP